jgi:hypothetical protein
MSIGRREDIITAFLKTLRKLLNPCLNYMPASNVLILSFTQRSSPSATRAPRGHRQRLEQSKVFHVCTSLFGPTIQAKTTKHEGACMRHVKAFVSLLALTAALGFAPAGCTPGVGGGSCCRVCTVGKPCGNTCISASYDCNTPGGCACYGSKRAEQLAGN